MGLTFESIESYETALQRAMESVMLTDVADRAKLIISDVIDQRVYSQKPLFYNRTGALKSPENMIASFSGDTLEIENIAPWNEIGFFRTHGEGTRGKELADAIQTDKIYNADPREFVKPAEDALGDGRLDRTIEATLLTRGF